MTTQCLPRVTEILRATGLAPDYSAIPAGVLDMARQRGLALHRAIEAAHYGILDESSLPADMRLLLDGYYRFYAEHRHVPLVSERLVAHRVWGYRGHLDRIGMHGPERVLCDWKTGSPDTAAACYQLAAYRAAWEHERPQEPIDRAWMVVIQPGRYVVHDLTPDLAAAWPVFQAALVVYRAQRVINKEILTWH